MSYSRVEKAAHRDYMKYAERGGEPIEVAGILFVALFFYAHQAWSTGFFTSSFGLREAFFLYGSILIGTVGPISRLITGRRNISRPPEVMASLLTILGSIWLFIVFPFNFAHFAAVMPGFLQFLLSWITNEIARVLFTLAIIGEIIGTVVNAIIYIKIRKLLLPQQMH